MDIYQVDAFTETLFKGNPAAIIPLKKWMNSEDMQHIAAENNLSETAFLVKKSEDRYGIRWFTPETEVDLCGHATLASAHVLFEHLGFSGEKIRFDSHSGELNVQKKDNLYWLDFPSQPPSPVSVPKLLPEAIGCIPIYTGTNVDLLILVDSEKTVQKMKPDLEILKRMDVRGVIVTAEAEESGIDFVSRFFAPAVGVPEDPVTGSAHTVLTPFWSKKLGKTEFKAKQLSKRGGTLDTILKDDRVWIGGPAVTYMTGKIEISE
ncbi:PhzF family phenazine biosynthesis protein [Rhodohalobacter sp. SW132]|uniref:PhzF family phenazine biosynthesis protein n=1 Tax=Rhodohalobacter sp. SW132 TaxID=2293433 RepID=UPI000E2321F6|nr:PhzF family phenazine biosynthesis protein [Rhodohalobacter sp. SW132]REL37603.1 PhzF family phenazine biosynthesis protein [Rhodohalobacter sp. SW132]